MIPARLSPRLRVACCLVLFAAMLAPALAHVARQRQIVEVGYDLGKAMGDLRRLEEEGRRLNLELSVLTAPARIERLAGELGMVRPPPGSVRVVRATTELALVR